MRVPVEALEGGQGVVLELWRGDLSRWEECQGELAARGIPLPLEHRTEWLREVARGEYWFLSVRSASDASLKGAFPLRGDPVRSLPGHVHLFLTRLGRASDAATLAAVGRALETLAHRMPRVLAITVDVFLADVDRRRRLEGALRASGFVQLERGRNYLHTLRVGLLPPESEILSSFSSSARRFIRNPAKKGYRQGRVSEDDFAGRMDQLWSETFARTGAEAPVRNWLDHVRFARAHPELYRIEGVFAPEVEGPSALVAFACGRNHGDHVAYADGGSTREVEPGVALTYAPMWALMRWGKEQGCAWFDLGGVPSDSHDGDGENDSLSGITAFKRRFSEDVIEVGSEWRFDAPGLRSGLARALGRGAQALRSLMSPGR